MKPGTTLHIQVSEPDHQPLQLGGLIVNAVFYSHGAERYRFDAGETNADGSLIVTYDDMNAIREENQKLALMDYNTRLDDCDDSIVICAPSSSELDARLTAMEKWYPEDSAQLRKRIAASTNAAVLATPVTVSVESGGVHAVELICKRV